MALSRKRLMSLARDALHRGHGISFDSLPEAWRQTIEAAAETASRECRGVSPKWAIEEAWLGLRDTGLAKVVDATIRYFFPGTPLTVDEFQALLAVARDAEANGLAVRAVVEEAWRRLIVDRRDAAEGLAGPHGVGP